MFVEQSKIYQMDCIKGCEYFYEAYGRCVDLVVTSPPYAEQRKKQYDSISEENYPEWTLKWMDSMSKILKDNGSVFIIIRPHIKNGVISDYVLKTRLLLRENGWYENEELIWIKPDSPPLGSTKRPRRAWESILWFSKSRNPKCYPKANGAKSNRIGFEANKFEQGGDSHIHGGQNKAKEGISRHRDYIEVGTSKNKKTVKHTAMYPMEVPYYLINMCTDEKDIVLDPFIGSGTTAEACVELGRGFIGFDTSSECYDISTVVVKDRIIMNKKDMEYIDFMELL